jgi:DNA polymerase-3 subunit beta
MSNMVIDCKRKEFLDAVSLAATPSSSRATTMPVLQSLLVEAGDNQLRLVGCDGEMWVERKLPTMVSNQGALALNAKLLQEILGSLPEGDVHLEQPNESSVRLSLGQSDYRVVGLSADDFPQLPPVTADAQVTMKAKDFADMVESVSFAVAHENQGRQVLTGILFDFDGDTLKTVATDTHRLAVRIGSFPGIGAAVTAIVPGRAMNVIRRLPVTSDGEISLSFGGNRLVVETDGARVVTQLLDGQFPPYERVIPSNSTRKWLLDRETLAGCVKRCSVLAKDNSQRIVFKSSGDQLTLHSRSEGVGEVKEEMALMKEGEDVEIAFNGKYVSDAISPITSPQVVIEMTESERAAGVKAADDDKSYLCVIMPMALM